MAAPSNLKFSPDGSYLTFLHSGSPSAPRSLWGVHLESGDRKLVVAPQSKGNTEETLSLAEKLRRERQRQLAVGVTEYQWSSNASKPYILIPQAGNLYVQDGVDGELRLLFDQASTGASGGAIAPQLSPDGTQVAFVQDDEIYVMPLDGSAPAEQVTSGARGEGVTNGIADFLAQEEMDRYDGFWWGPDSASIAFEQVDESHIPVYRIMHQGKDDVGAGAQEDHRYPFAGADNPRVKLGVVALATKAVTWMDTGGDGPLVPHPAGTESEPTDIYLARVHWLPNGQLVAELLNRQQTVLHIVRFTSDGKRVLVLEEASPDGWVNIHNVFKVLPAKEGTGSGTGSGSADEVSFLWASERTGFRHLYLYKLDLTSTEPAALVRQVTGGQFVLRSLNAFDAATGLAYITCSVGSPLYLHLCRVNVFGGAATAPTSFGGPGFHDPDSRPKDEANVTYDAGVSAVKDWQWAGDAHPEALVEFGVERVTSAPGQHTTAISPTFSHVVDLHHSAACEPTMTLYRFPGDKDATPASLSPKSPLELSVLHPPPAEEEGAASPVTPDAGEGEEEEEAKADDGAAAGGGGGGGGGGATTAAAPLFTRSAPKIPPKLVAFPTRDGGEVLFGALYAPDPDRFGPGPYPTLISVYGGPGVARVTDSWVLSRDARAQNFRDRGFLVFKVDNRGSFHRGTRFETALRHHMGTVELDDQVDAVKYLTAAGLCDASRVGIFGWSYGGYMTLMALAKAPSVFHVGVSGAPVTDWDGYDTAYTERYMSTPQGNPDGYKDSSVLTHAADIKGKLMLVHGLIDENVHFRHTARLINSLVSHRIEYDLLLFPEERHTPRRPQDCQYMEERIAKYFIDHLGTVAKL